MTFLANLQQKGPQVIITERTDCLLRKETLDKENFIKWSLRIKLCQQFNKNKPMGGAEEDMMSSVVLTLKSCLYLKLTSWNAYYNFRNLYSFKNSQTNFYCTVFCSVKEQSRISVSVFWQMEIHLGFKLLLHLLCLHLI